MLDPKIASESRREPESASQLKCVWKPVTLQLFALKSTNRSVFLPPLLRMKTAYQTAVWACRASRLRKMPVWFAQLLAPSIWIQKNQYKERKCSCHKELGELLSSGKHLWQTEESENGTTQTYTKVPKWIWSIRCLDYARLCSVYFKQPGLS